MNSIYLENVFKNKTIKYLSKLMFQITLLFAFSHKMLDKKINMTLIITKLLKVKILTYTPNCAYVSIFRNLYRRSEFNTASFLCIFNSC